MKKLLSSWITIIIIISSQMTFDEDQRDGYNHFPKWDWTCTESWERLGIHTCNKESGILSITFANRSPCNLRDHKSYMDGRVIVRLSYKILLHLTVGDPLNQSAKPAKISTILSNNNLKLWRGNEIPIFPMCKIWNYSLIKKKNVLEQVLLLCFMTHSGQKCFLFVSKS